MNSALPKAESGHTQRQTTASGLTAKAVIALDVGAMMTGRWLALTGVIPMVSSPLRFCRSTQFLPLFIGHGNARWCFAHPSMTRSIA